LRLRFGRMFAHAPCWRTSSLIQSASSYTRSRWVTPLERDVVLETFQEFLERYVGFDRRFLLHPMTNTRQNNRSTKIRAAGSRICVKIHSGDEGANGVAFASYKVRRLRHRFSSEVCHFPKIDVLGSIAMEGTAKATGSKCFDEYLQILFAHPIGKRSRIDHAIEQFRADWLVF